MSSHNARNAQAGEQRLLGTDYEENIARTTAQRNLEKAKANERKLISKGWRYIRISPRTTLLLPCTPKGKPTKEALRRIEYYKTRLNA